MTITTGSNIASLQAQRRLAQGNSALGISFERLGSGMRINRASDDAAGLAIASSLTADTRLYSQAIRNVNDAISALNIAGAALTSLGDISIRQRELAEQAANGTYSVKQRLALDEEANALVDEFNRISATTTFNGRQLFGSTFTIQAGIRGSSTSTISIDIASEALRSHGDGYFDAAYTELSSGAALTRSVALGDLNGDGVDDIVLGNHTSASFSIIISNGDGTFQAARLIATPGQVGDLTLADVDHDGRLDIVGRVSGTAFGVLRGNGDGSFRAVVSYAQANAQYQSVLADFNNDGALDYVSVGSSGISLHFGRSDGTFGSEVILNADNALDPIVADINNDNRLDVGYISGGILNMLAGNGDGTFSKIPIPSVSLGNSFDLSDFNRDGNLDVVYRSSNNTVVGLGDGSGSFSTVATLANSAALLRNFVRDINGDGYGDIISYSSQSASTVMSLRVGNGDGTFQAAMIYAPPAQLSAFHFDFGDVTGDGADDIVLVEESGTPGAVVFEANLVRDLSQPHINLLTQAEARGALDDTTLDNLSRAQASIGAATSRLQTALSNLSSSREGATQAASRIMDADMAAESAELARTQILQQAAASVLSQANQQPALALTLLRA